MPVKSPNNRCFGRFGRLLFNGVFTMCVQRLFEVLG